jgi:hypothetical protein
MLTYQSASAGVVGALGLGLLFAAPWVVAAVWLWRRGSNDGTVAPSPGELARRRLGL